MLKIELKSEVYSCKNWLFAFSPYREMTHMCPKKRKNGGEKLVPVVFIVFLFSVEPGEEYETWTERELPLNHGLAHPALCRWSKVLPLSPFPLCKKK